MGDRAVHHATHIHDSHDRAIDGLLASSSSGRARHGGGIGRSRQSEAAMLPCGNGGVLFYQGDPAEHLFEVVEGVVKLYMLTPDGRRQVTCFCYPGQFLGHGAEEAYLQTAEAVGPAMVRRYPRARMESLMIEQPELANRLLRMTLDQLSVAQDQMLNLGRKTATERMASFILGLLGRDRGEREASAELHLPMARTDIADYLGLTPETVSRVLGRLKAVGVIALRTANDIEVRDLRRLGLLAEDETALVLN